MTVAAARHLRRSMTDAEKALWQVLRSRQLAGFKFRRQQPLQRYVLDFVCFSHRLVVEVDGGQHANAVDRDERRSQFLAREGFRVLRFWNNDVLENRSGVCARLLEALGERAPSPRPSPTGRAEGFASAAGEREKGAEGARQSAPLRQALRRA